MKKLRKWLLGILLAASALALFYVIYAFAAYYRLEDNLTLTVEDNPAETARPGEAYTLLLYNVGFGAYSADYSFFMDGGTYSRAVSPTAVGQNLAGAVEAVAAEKPDFVLFEEVDVNATRSYHVDQRPLLRTSLPSAGAVFAQNYNSPYLLWPLYKPHGKSVSGMLTLSNYKMSGALRRSLPVETGLTKFVDLDRCYSVIRLPVSNGRELCLYTVHLSAYTSDGSIATEQLSILLSDMADEYADGNYAVCGGDFNKDLLGDSGAVFGIFQKGDNWAQPFPEDLAPEGLTLTVPFDPERPVPSCRNAAAPL